MPAETTMKSDTTDVAKSDAEQLRLLRQKIKAGLNKDAVIDARSDRPPVCRDCFQRGWHAALKYLLGD